MKDNTFFHQTLSYMEVIYSYIESLREKPNILHILHGFFF